MDVPRRGSIHWLYYRIADKQCHVYSEFDTKMSQVYAALASGDEVDQKWPEYYQNREQAAVIGITFAAMCLEAFFYDYVAATVGDDFTKQHLDKLDLPSKLLIFPRLVCGKTIQKSSHIFERVKWLTRERNDLVHFKSRSFGPQENDNLNNFHDELNERYRKALPKAVETVKLVLQELDKLHETTDYLNQVCNDD